MIFARRYNTSKGVNSSILEEYNFPMGVPGGKSGNCPTQNLVDAYEMQSTGKLWNEEGSGYDAANPYAGRDPRFGMTVVKMVIPNGRRRIANLSRLSTVA